MSEVSFRFATIEDLELIYDFIYKLAVYEKLENEVECSLELLKEWIFEKKKAEVMFCVVDSVEVGFCLFFHNFSTFLGKAGIYLEDLFVLEKYRHKGYGKQILKKLAQITIERGCGRLEFSCLNWNTPSIEFYLNNNAERLTEWNTYRFTKESLKNLAGENEV